MGLGFLALIWPELKCPALPSPLPICVCVCEHLMPLYVCASASGEDFHQQFYRPSAIWVVAATAIAPLLALPDDILALWGWFRSRSMVPGFGFSGVCFPLLVCPLKCNSLGNQYIQMWTNNTKEYSLQVNLINVINCTFC